MLIFNHKRIIGFEYRKDKDGWKFHKATGDRDVIAEIGKAVFRPPQVSSEYQPRLHITLLLETLNRHNLDGGSMLEISEDTMYRVQIEVKSKEKKFQSSQAAP